MERADDDAGALPPVPLAPPGVDARVLPIDLGAGRFPDDDQYELIVRNGVAALNIGDAYDLIQGTQEVDILRGIFRPPPIPHSKLTLEKAQYVGDTVSAIEMGGQEGLTADIEEIPEDGQFIPAKVDDLPVTDVWMSILTQQSRQVDIHLYTFAVCRPDFTIVFYGKRRTGKTSAVLAHMKAMRIYYPEVYVFTGTKIDAEYEPCVPLKFIVDGFKEDVLEAILKRQEQRVENMRKKGVNDENIYVLVIMDDCITSNDVHDSEVLKRAFFNGRHLYMSIIINSQDAKAIGPNLRANTDMVACFRVRSERDKEAIRKNYMDFLKNDDEFDEIANEIAKVPYNIMFVDQARPYQPPEQTVYCGVMPDPETEIFPFFMGSREYWSESKSQLIRHGGEHLLLKEDWGLVKDTYKFKMHKVYKPRGQ